MEEVPRRRRTSTQKAKLPRLLPELTEALSMHGTRTPRCHLSSRRAEHSPIFAPPVNHDQQRLGATVKAGMEKYVANRDDRDFSAVVKKEWREGKSLADTPTAG